MQVYMYAALPWLLMAVMAALMYFFTKKRKAREAERRREQSGLPDAEPVPEQDDRMMEGMCVGSALGLCLGQALGRPLLCVCFFMLCGMFIGSNIKKYKEK